MSGEGRSRKGLCHDIGDHLGGRNVIDFDETLLNLFSDEVFVQSKVTSTVVELRVARESVGTLVVAEEGGGMGKGVAEFGEKLREEDGFFRRMGKTEVLSFGGGTSDSRLKLG